MTAPLTSPSFPLGLPKMGSEAQARAARPLSMVDTINRCVSQRGMSDDQRNDEWEAQGRLYYALDELRAAILGVNSSSVLVDVSIAALDAFIHDEIPDVKNWDEKISEARNG